MKTQAIVVQIAIASSLLFGSSTALSSPSGKYEPAMCRFNGSAFRSCQVLDSYINRAGGWMTKIMKRQGTVYVFRQESSAAGDPYRDSKGQIWTTAYDSSNNTRTFINPKTGESIVVKKYR